MNIQQLEYVIAVDTYRHFSRAAEASFVTQPTLSMMIQKLEEELANLKNEADALKAIAGATHRYRAAHY